MNTRPKEELYDNTLRLDVKKGQNKFRQRTSNRIKSEKQQILVDPIKVIKKKNTTRRDKTLRSERYDKWEAIRNFLVNERWAVC